MLKLLVKLGKDMKTLEVSAQRSRKFCNYIDSIFNFSYTEIANNSIIVIYNEKCDNTKEFNQPS